MEHPPAAKRRKAVSGDWMVTLKLARLGLSCRVTALFTWSGGVFVAVRGASDHITQIALTWEGVQVSPHRFGGVEFRLGRREIGHMHGDGLVDIPFPTRVRQEVVAHGLAETHHILPDSGWVSVYIRESADIERALTLLRRSYELARRQKA